MKNLKHLSLVTCLTVGGASLLGGCASSHEPAESGLPPERARYLYPREHYESLDQAQRAELERQQLEKQNRTKQSQ